jgi:hypothetical protein
MQLPSSVRFSPCLGFVLLLSTATGCGGGSKQAAPPPPDQPVTISTQPANATVPLDSTGTFTVVATGTGPLSYQWNKEGEAISGATASSYTTPSVELGNSGDTYTVTVSNTVSSVTSAQALLTVGPRSPKPGDIRFKLVGSQALQQWTNDGPDTLQWTWQPSASNAFGTPMEIGDEICFPANPYPNCAWAFDIFSLPPGGMPLSVVFKAGYLTSFETDLGGLNAPDTVIQSLDFQTAVGVYGSEWLTIQGGQFDLAERVVSPGAITSTVAADGLKSRVITAVSFEATGQAHLISYGWQGDTTTQYETSVSIVGPPDVVAAAQSLANAGFIITAFGGNDTNGYVLIGTKVRGDFLPRLLQAYPQYNQGGRSWAEVARLTWNGYGGPSASSGYEFVSVQ